MGVKNAILKPRFFTYLGVFILLMFMPRVLPVYHLILLESGITFAIMALGFNLLLRYTGLLSFGHGALFATGAYAVGMMGKYFPDLYRVEILIPVALLASFVVSTIFGFICVRHTRVFFSILALALSMVLFALLVKLYNITGGSDGIHIELPIMFGKSFEGMKRFEFLSGAYYYFLICVFAVSTIIMFAIVNSPFGKALQSIRDNEVRAEMIGIRVRRYRLYSFILSGLFTGLGGAMWSFVNGHVSPEIAEWMFSGEIVYMTLLGGFMVFEGPIIGAILFTYLRLYAVTMTQYWMFLIGATLIILVLLLPEGITGGFAKLFAKMKRSPSNGVA
ncbi:MAG: branched-chain amino acid ABC transporter permease [Desulfobacterales bacterium]|nr:branched-chain amino acid ABC transporter permease [Desulfobacterales bacterium]MBL7102449.1 branched-chain amino acid ABC transporter permease [Desulfobacteraceae bacterium]MBL7173847.1 branched-chain amino acid ABC transporter permease [Desulfobacteraceae bacterium]MBU0990573.1 branched-chain amino acid ABC transporter permease [Pseudomonadota bacterium]